jgi:hypothetical protein
MSGNYIGSGPAPGGMILVGDTNPIGMVNWFHGVPDGSWLQLNGQIVAKATYPDLWVWAQGFLTADQVLNPGLYRSVDANTFALPNLDGLFIRSTGGIAPNAAAALGVKQADMVGPHTHTIAAQTQADAGQPGAGRYAGVTQNTVGGALVNSGTETRPLNVALMACVKAKRTTLVATTGAPAGRIVQNAAHVRGDFLTQAGAIPFDDTIPQITEGAEFLQVPNFVPLTVGNRIRLSAFFNYTISVAGTANAACLFRSGTTDALAVSWSSPVNAANWNWQMMVGAEFVVADLTPRTYSFRFGTAGGGNIQMNGANTGRLFGGALLSWLRVEEFN